MATRKGGLTGSKRFEVNAQEDKIEPTSKEPGILQTAQPPKKTVLAKPSDGYSRAIQIASENGVAPVEIAELLGSNQYSADGNVPLMDAAEKNAHLMKLQQQANSIEVRHQKIKLGRSIVKMATEQMGLIGDTVELATASVVTATKAVKNDIATVQYDTELSKLELTRELHTHQHIATAGTQRLTAHLQAEWDLKVSMQGAKNAGLHMDLENVYKSMEMKKNEMISRLIY